MKCDICKEREAIAEANINVGFKGDNPVLFVLKSQFNACLYCIQDSETWCDIAWTQLETPK